MMMSLLGAVRCVQGLSVLQQHALPAAASMGCRMLRSLAASSTAAAGGQQLAGVAALAQCLLGQLTSSSTSSSSLQSTNAVSTSCSSSSSTQEPLSPSLGASSSLRGELGSGAALGTVPAPRQQRSDSDTARRRESLLTQSGRFYETVVVAPFVPTAASQQQQQQDLEAGSPSRGYQLLLRKYPLKTPGKKLLVLPTRSLALAVAAEWEWLPKGKPVPHMMPLMSLSATAIDQPKERSKVLEHLLKYVHTDGACIRYEPGTLEQRQAAMFDPLLLWARQQLGWSLATSHSIFGTQQDEATVAAVEAWLQGLNKWHLAAAEQLITASKSVVIAAALLYGRINVAQAVAASRIEEEFQLEDWGMVEAGHDLDIADARSRIGAPAVFARLLALP